MNFSEWLITHVSISQKNCWIPSDRTVFYRVSIQLLLERRFILKGGTFFSTDKPDESTAENMAL